MVVVSLSFPSPLDPLGSRRFSFYPPIRDIENNEWMFRRADSGEIHVVNTRSLIELAIPRHYIGEVSSVAEPVVIVGLLKELEFKAGAVVPHVRLVIEMPRAVNGSRTPAPRAQHPAAVVGIRVEPQNRSRILLGALAAALLACVAVISFAPRVELPFTAHDNYDSIVARMGPPAHDESRTTGGEQYRRLSYPQRALTLLLIDGHYAGALDSDGHVIHAVRPLHRR